MQSEIDIVRKLIAPDSRPIVFNDEGCCSRAYLVGDGDIVFKFPKWPDIKYDNEAANLALVCSLGADINLQKAAFTAPGGEYIGMRGIVGICLRDIYTELPDTEKRAIGARLAGFLKKLHAASAPHAPRYSLSWELEAWGKKYAERRDALHSVMSSAAAKKLDRFMNETVPARLPELGEDPVFAHGDLDVHNVIIAPDGTPGIIDFAQSGYLDRSADFMDMCDPVIKEAMLDAYGADAALREKTAIRSVIGLMPGVMYFIRKDRPDMARLLADDIRAGLSQR